VRDLTYGVGGVRILEDVNLGVAEGEFIGVIGPNGAGKTTLFNLLSGLVLPTRGQVLLGGRDVSRLTVHARARAGLGRTFQTSSVFPALSAVENVRLAAEAGAGARMWGRPAGRGGRLVEHARSCLERVGLTGQEEAAAGSLSHGEKRKLELAILLAGRPRLLLLDEPMAGLGMEDVPEVTELIRGLHSEEGLTVLMVEHHIEVILGLADRIAVMHHGSLLACDTPDAVMADPAVQGAYLGEAL